MLSTIDNPFDPFDQFDDWLEFDIDKGYYSCAYLARIANIGDDFTEKEANDEIGRAIDEIVKYNPLGIYIKVSKKLSNSDSNSDEIEDLEGNLEDYLLN